MPSAPNPIQTALLILTPIRSNRCAQLLRRHSPQGGTPTLRHGASTIYTSRAPAPDSPTPHVSRMQRTEETAIHSQHGSIHRKGAHRRSGTMHASARTSTHQSTVSTARAPRSMYPASSAQTKPPYTASAAPSTARRHTDAPARRMLQHTPTHTSPASSTVSTARAPRPMLPEKPATRARHKLRHRSRDTLQPIRSGRLAARTHRKLRLRLGPARRAAQPQRPKTQPYGHKKRSDLSI